MAQTLSYCKESHGNLALLTKITFSIRIPQGSVLSRRLFFCLDDIHLCPSKQFFSFLGILLPYCNA